MKRNVYITWSVVGLVILGLFAGPSLLKAKPTLTPTGTPAGKVTSTPARTNTPRPTVIVTTVTFTQTPPATDTPAVTNTPPGMGFSPYPEAPLCPEHDNTLWHGLWNAQAGCHYDHTHFDNPFTPEVAAAFPDFDLKALLCENEIGSCHPSSTAEIAHKHIGFFWQVDLNAPNGTALGFEGATTAVCKYALQVHAHPDYGLEFETRVHSAAALFEQCREGSDPGQVFVTQHLDYGERAWAYQGPILHYPDDPTRLYDPAFAPYWTAQCVGADISDPYRAADCIPSLQEIVTRGRNVNTTWTSNPRNLTGSGSRLLVLLLRGRNVARVPLTSDQSHPYDWRWVCSQDDGLTFEKDNCRWTGSTFAAHQLQGTIPNSWDNLPGFDTDPEVGRITAEGYVTRFGVLNPACAAVGPDCHFIKLVRAFVGNYGSLLIPDKITAFSKQALPENNIFFCAGVPCLETDFGAVPSGWIDLGD